MMDDLDSQIEKIKGTANRHGIIPNEILIVCKNDRVYLWQVTDGDRLSLSWAKVWTEDLSDIVMIDNTCITVTPEDDQKVSDYIQDLELAGCTVSIVRINADPCLV